MKSRVQISAWVVLLLVILAGVACTKAPDNNQVTGQIQTRLNEDSGLQGKPITVQTSNGVVTLSGRVDNEAQRAAAARYAAAIPGIREVVNNLQVADSTPATSAAHQMARARPAPAKPAAKSKPHLSRPRRIPVSTAMAAADPAPAMRATAQDPPAPAQAATPPSAPAVPATPPPPAAPAKVTIPAGTTLAIRLVDAIDSEKAQPGETFRATLNSPLASEGDVAIPAGYDVEGQVVDVKSAGKFAGRSELVLQLSRISVGAKSYSIQTDQYRRQGSSRGTNTAEKVGAGAAIGAIIGGLAGGGKGAGIGAAAGGGLGGGVQAATKGQQIKLPAETVLNFTLQSPLTVTPVSGPNSGRQKLENPQQ
ncbi:MAG: BON domain-containing protein [Terriglobales bacterium]